MVDLKNIKRLLIIRLSSLGDVLLTTPLIRSIKTNYPEIQIDYIVKDQYVDALKHNPFVSCIFTYNNLEKSFLPKVNSELNYDLVIDLQNNLKSKQIVSKINAPAVKFNKRNTDKFLLVHFKINRMKSAPSVAERYASTIPGYQLNEEGLDLFIPDNIKSKLTKPGTYVGLCPGSRHFTKMWPIEYYIELGNILSRNGYTVLLFGGKSDRDICKRIADAITNAKDMSNDDNLLQTAADMKECMCIICNDSGLMHAASAVKTPVVVILGSTVKEFGFIPNSKNSSILENNLLSCRPCSHIGRNKCPKGHFNCMREIKPSKVYETFVELLRTL